MVIIPDVDRSLDFSLLLSIELSFLQEYTLTALLNTAQTVPLCTASAGGATGNAVMTYSTETKELCIYLSYTGLSGTELFSHIHGPASFGTAGGIVKTLTSGQNKLDCFTFTEEEQTSLLSGLLYFNVHSPACNTGEIRGQILPAA